MNRWGTPITSPETREKQRRAKLGNANAAKAYPAFVHAETGRVIPAGRNLAAMCRERELSRVCMMMVMHGKAGQHRGWRLLE